MKRLDGLGDAALLELARERDSDAYAELWRRHHRAGLKAARGIAPSLESEDLVSEAFAKILSLLERGKGPANNFRPYLYTVVRNVAMDTFRQTQEVVSADEIDELPGESLVAEDIVHEFDQQATKDAFESLPDREQEVLWYTEVEGLAPRKVAPILGISAGATSALAMRARKRLRTAWLAEHIPTMHLLPECEETVAALSGYFTNELSDDARARVDAHLPNCMSCSQLLREAERMYARPGSAIAIAVLGTSLAGALTLGNWNTVRAVAALLLGTKAKAAMTLVAAFLVAAVVGGIVTVYQRGADVSGGKESGQDAVAEGKPTTSPGERTSEERAAEGDARGTVPPAQEGGDASGAEANGGDAGVGGATASSTPPTESGAGTGPTTPPTVTSPGSRPEEPNEPGTPDVSTSLPQTLPAPGFDVMVTDPSRLAIRGRGAAPGAEVRLLITSQPVAGGPQYGVVMSTRAWSTGYWSFANVGGITPLNVTVQAQQLTAAASSPWATVVAGRSFPLEVKSTAPGNFNGVEAWYVRGWPGSHWALREVGADWPRSAGQLSNGGGASVPVPADIPAGQVREYEVGYWVKGRFEPSGIRLTARG